MNRYAVIHVIHLGLLIFIHQIHNGGGFSQFVVLSISPKTTNWENG
jgi:hypothetical protein